MTNVLFYFFCILPAIGGTPFHYNIFQENSHPATETRQRNKNWCAYVTQRNASCVVSGGTESVLLPEVIPCPVEHMNCVQQVIYRTHFRPMYKVGYKIVSELGWRCCPGYQGYDCNEVKDMNLLSARRSHAPPLGQNTPQGAQWKVEHPSAGGANFPKHSDNKLSLTQPGAQNALHLEEEVQRLSQMVLDMQVRMTDMASNLRVDFQEDASKMLVSLMNNLKQPASARGSETQTLPIQEFSFENETVHIYEVLNRINQVRGDVEFNTNGLADLFERVVRHDGQIRLLMETTEKPPASPPPAHRPDLRPYVDELIRNLREELMEGIDIKMADLKNSCDYKMMSVQEYCESQESLYLSLTELMDSKESDLRKEIQDLKSKLEGDGLEPSGSRYLPDSVVTRLENMERCLNISEKDQCVSFTGRLSENQSKAFQDLKRTVDVKIASLQDKLSPLLANTNINSSPALNSTHDKALDRNTNFTENSIQSLLHRFNVTEAKMAALEKIHVDCKKDINTVKTTGQEPMSETYSTEKSTVGQEIAHLDSRMEIVEGLCNKLEPISNSLQRIKDGLNKHISGLWTCVNQMNGTVRAQSREMDQLRATCQSLQKPLSEVANGLESFTTIRPKNSVDNVAGPPQPGRPKGEHPRPKITVMETGEAGPPGRMSSSQLPRGADGIMAPVQGFAGAPASSVKSSETVKPLVPIERMAFSAGLTLTPFLGDIGIIRFNKVLVNDGGHYDPYTGIFHAPADGRYLVSAVLAPQHGEKVEAVLSVSNHSIQKLDSRGFYSEASVPHEQCNCSSVASLSLVLPLKQGDRVGLVLTAGKMAISSSPEILSSFSVVLLYTGLDQR